MSWIADVMEKWAHPWIWHTIPWQRRRFMSSSPHEIYLLLNLSYPTGGHDAKEDNLYSAGEKTLKYLRSMMNRVSLSLYIYIIQNNAFLVIFSHLSTILRKWKPCRKLFIIISKDSSNYDGIRLLKKRERFITVIVRLWIECANEKWCKAFNNVS